MTKNSIEMFLSTNVRFLCAKLGWSGAELARRAGVPKQFITDISSGRSPRGLANLRKVAVACELSGIDELVFTDLSKKKPQKGQPDSIFNALFEEQGSVFRGRFEVVIKKLKE